MSTQSHSCLISVITMQGREKRRKKPNLNSRTLGKHKTKRIAAIAVTTTENALRNHKQ